MYISAPLLVVLGIAFCSLSYLNKNKKRKLVHYQSIYLLGVINRTNTIKGSRSGWHNEKDRIAHALDSLTASLLEPDFPEDDMLLAEINSVVKSLFDCRRDDLVTEVSDKVDELSEVVNEFMGNSI
jgi:hypothetical protein